MALRFVVTAMPPEDGIPRVLGVFREEARALAFADSVNARVEANETRDHDAAQAKYEDDGVTPYVDLSYGRAHVRILHTPRVATAVRWCMGDYS